MRNFSALIVFLLAIPCFSQPYVLLDTKNDHQTPIEVMTLAPDGETLLSADKKGNLIFWDLNDMSVKYRVRAHGSAINTIFFNSSGSRFVTAGDDGKVKLWSYPDYKLISSYNGPYDGMNFAVLSPDGKYIYFGGYAHQNGNAISSSTQSFTGLYRIKIGGSGYPELLFNDNASRGYDIYTGTSDWGITDGCLDPSGKYVLFTKGYYFYVWDIAANELKAKVSCPYNTNNITARKNGVYVWAEGRMVKYSAGDSYSLSKFVSAGNKDVGYSRMVFSAAGNAMVTGDDGNLVHIWNSSTLQKTQVLSGHTGSVRTFAFCRKDSVLLTGSYDGTIKIWGFPKPVIEERDTLEAVSFIPTDTAANVQIKPIRDTQITKVREVVFTDDNVPVSVLNRPVEKQGTFYVTTEEFEIEIWDNSVYDHDIISLNINGDWVLDNYEVTKEKTKVKIKLKPNTNNYLILYAQNLGEISPNTAAVGLLVDGKLQRLTISSDLKKCGALNFEYRP